MPPIPKPKDKEKRSAFVSRCMSQIGSEYENNKQAVAICYNAFNEAKASAEGVIDLGNDDEMLVLGAQKTYKGKTRTELKDSDFLFPDTRSFPIVSPQDVRDAINNFGRMKGGMSYDQFIKKLYNKAKSKGPDFVAAIPESTKKAHNLSQASQDSLPEYQQDFFQMSSSSIASIAQHAQNIIDALNDPQVKKNLQESWLQGKIAITEDYMLTIHNYVMFSKED